MSRRGFHPNFTAKCIWRSLLLAALLYWPTHGYAQDIPEKGAPAQKQTNWASRSNVPEFIERIKSGEYGAVHVDLVARAGAAEAIPVLREQFAKVEDPVLKAKIAGALVMLGDKDQTYWNFLLQYAMPALESDAPDFVNYDSLGKASPGPSPRFVEWANAHNLPVNETGAEMVYGFPLRLILLAWPRDPRAIPLLRRALLSPNYQIEITAAKGLSEIGDKASIPSIIAACKRAPAEVAEAMAEALVYFDDDAAQSAVDHYVSKERASVYRDARAHGKKSPWYVPMD